MTRRPSKAALHARRWYLYPSLTTAGITAYWTHDPWPALTAMAATWTLVGIGKAILRRKPPPQARRPEPTTAPAGPLGWEPHVLYDSWRDEAGHDLAYIGVCSIHPSRSVVNRIIEHDRDEPWWPAIHHVTPRAYYPGEHAAKRAEAHAIHTAVLAGARLYNRTHINCQPGQCPTLRASPQEAA